VTLSRNNRSKGQQGTRPRVVRAMVTTVAPGCGASALVVAIAFVLLFLFVTLANTEYRVRTRQTVLLTAPSYLTDRMQDWYGDGEPIVARLRLLSFEENANSLSASLFFYSRNTKFNERIRSNPVTLTVKIIDAIDPGGEVRLVAAPIAFDTTDTGFVSIRTNSLEFTPYTASDIWNFPFDEYQFSLIISLTLAEDSGGLYSPPFNLEVERIFPGRVIRGEGSSDVSAIFIQRAPNDVYILLGSSFIFIMTCMAFVWHLWRHKQTITNTEEAAALAGLVLAAGGFREFAGFSEFKTRTFLELFIFFPVLLALLVIFLIMAYRASSPARVGATSPSQDHKDDQQSS
jgi:hypothetical protein